MAEAPRLQRLYFTCIECGAKQDAGISAPEDFHDNLVDDFDEQAPDKGQHVRSAEAHRCAFCGAISLIEVSELTFDSSGAREREQPNG